MCTGVSLYIRYAGKQLANYMSSQVYNTINLKCIHTIKQEKHLNIHIMRGSTVSIWWHIHKNWVWVWI